MAQDPTMQGFLTGGEHDSGERLTPGPGFGPGGSPTPQLGVYQPLDVTAPQAQADALAKALGVGMSIAEPVALKKIEKDAEDDASRGKVDALTNPGQEPTDGTRAYQAGVHFTIVNRHGQNAVTDAEALRNTPQSQQVTLTDGTQAHGWGGLSMMDSRDPNGNLVPGLMTSMDSFFRSRLGGLETDPTAAKVLAPMVGNFIHKATSERIMEIRDNNLKDAVTSAVGAAQLSAQNEGVPFDYSAHFQALKDLNNGDGVEAAKMLNQGLVESAVQQGNERILDMIPKTITDAHGKEVAGPGMAPGTVSAVHGARSQIQAANAKLDQEAKVDLRYQTFAGWDDLHAAKRVVPEQAIQSALSNHTINQAEANEYHRKNDELRTSNEKSAVYANALASGTPWQRFIDTPLFQGKDERFNEAGFNGAMTDFVEKYPVAQRPSIAFAATERTGLVYGPLKATLGAQPLNTQQGVKEVLDAMQQMGNKDQSVLSNYIPDPERRATLDQLMSMRVNGKMSDEQLADFVKNVDLKKARSEWTEKLPAVQQIIGNAVVQDGWFSDKVKINDLVNGGDYVQRLTQVTSQVMRSGMYTDPEAAVKQAAKQMQDGGYVLNLGRGHSLYLPKTDQDQPASIAEPALQWFYDTQVPKIAKDNNFPGDVHDIQLTDHPYQPGTLGLLDPSGAPIEPGGGRYTVSSIVKSYKDYLANKRPEDYAAEQEARKRAAQFQWATSAANPTNHQ